MKAALLFVAASLLAAERGGTVDGTVTNRVTGAGVAGVSVKFAAIANPDKELYRVMTDATGAFRIEDLPEGNYVPSFDVPPGFLPLHPSEPIHEPFHVGRDPLRLQFALKPYARLAGRVVDGDSQPAPGIQVEICRSHSASGDFATTDEQGRFLFNRIVAGPHVLRAKPPVAQDTSCRQECWARVTTYFPSAPTREDADVIQVREGADLTGYEIKMRSAPVYRIRGIVVDTDGEPVTGAQTRLVSSTGLGGPEASSPTGPGGRFELGPVPAGKWQIAAKIDRAGKTWKGFSDVILPQHDLENETVVNAPPFPLQVIVEGIPKAPRDVYFLLILYPIDIGESCTTDTRPDGSLLFEKTYPGKYRVGVWSRLPAGYYLKSISLGTEDVTGRDVTLSSGSPPVRVRYEPNAARVRGRVTNGRGVDVLLIQTNGDDAIPGDSLRFAKCDRDGLFSIESVRPSTYYLLALRSRMLSTGEIYDTIFKLGLSKQAASVTLKEGETADIDLKITAWPGE